MYSRTLTEHEIQKWCIPDLKVPQGDKGDFSVVHGKLPAGKETTLISFRNSILRGENMRNVKFNHDCHITRLLTKSGGGQLMSDSPQERYEVVPAIKACRGNVLVGGLGLGMYIQMLTKNQRVRHITVVEIEPDIISLVGPSLPDGVRVVQADLFKFLEHCHWTWNNAIYDIWSPTSEGVFFGQVVPLRLMSITAGAKSKNIFCWAETEMFGQIGDSLSKAVALPDYWWPYNVFKRGLELFEKGYIDGPIAERMPDFKRPSELDMNNPADAQLALQQQSQKMEIGARNAVNPMFRALVAKFVKDIGSPEWMYLWGAAWGKAWSERRT